MQGFGSAEPFAVLWKLGCQLDKLAARADSGHARHVMNRTPCSTMSIKYFRRLISIEMGHPKPFTLMKISSVLQERPHDPMRRRVVSAIEPLFRTWKNTANTMTPLTEITGAIRLRYCSQQFAR
nr:hypothetical protein [Falsiruegeria litorea]